MISPASWRFAIIFLRFAFYCFGLPRIEDHHRQPATVLVFSTNLRVLCYLPAVLIFPPMPGGSDGPPSRRLRVRNRVVPILFQRCLNSCLSVSLCWLTSITEKVL